MKVAKERIAHIFKPGSTVTLCNGESYFDEAGAVHRIYFPRRFTVPADDNSQLCPECRKQARFSFYRIRRKA